MPSLRPNAPCTRRYKAGLQIVRELSEAGFKLCTRKQAARALGISPQRLAYIEATALFKIRNYHG